jgi:hypothetical protein
VYDVRTGVTCVPERDEEQFERIGRWWRQLSATDRQRVRSNPQDLAPRVVDGLRQIGVLPASSSSDEQEGVALTAVVHDYINELEEE